MKNQIIVIKVGTGVVSKASGRLDDFYIGSLVDQICRLRKLGQKIVLVSSGAIGAGIEALSLSSRPKNLNKLQACAAIGQGRLMKLYEESFRKRGTHAAQILLTQDDFNNSSRRINAKHTLLSLLNDYKAVPVINENDSIALEEIKFGDNDKLSALVAKLVGAHTLIILTDVDGLYRPHDKKVISLVEKIDKKIEKLAGPSKGKFGMGGMIGKIAAAKQVTRDGIRCIIANGRKKDVLLRIQKNKDTGTTFLAIKKKRTKK